MMRANDLLSIGEVADWLLGVQDRTGGQDAAQKVA